MNLTFDQVFEALKGRPDPRSVPASQLPSRRQAWTRAALEAIGIQPTVRELETAAWSDRIVDLWDETEYFLARHAARLKRAAGRPQPKRRSKGASPPAGREG